MFDGARQVIRWGNPGSLFFIFLSMFFGVEYVVRGSDAASDPLFHLFADILKTDTPALLLAIVVALGIPIGYVITQYYHWAQWRLRWWHERPLDRGRMVLYNLKLSKVVPFWRPSEDELAEKFFVKDKDDRYKFRERWRRVIGKAAPADRTAGGHQPSQSRFGAWLELLPMFRTEELTDNLRHNWNLAESLWYHAITYKGQGGKEDRQYFETYATNISDIFHSLGAARVALNFATFLYLCAMLGRVDKPDILFHPDRWPWWLAWIGKVFPGVFTRWGVWSRPDLPWFVALGICSITLSLVFIPSFWILRANHRAARIRLVSHKREYLVSFFHEVDPDSIIYPPLSSTSSNASSRGPTTP